jgi:hypothetical protein
MCELNVSHHDVKRGGSYSKDKETGVETRVKWFSWMYPDYPDKYDTAKEILEELGFYVEEAKDGLVIEYYESKMGQENLFLESVSDLIVSSTGNGMPHIIWSGEDGGTWKEVYGEKEVKSFDGVISYPEEENLNKNASAS